MMFVPDQRRPIESRRAVRVFVIVTALAAFCVAQSPQPAKSTDPDRPRVRLKLPPAEPAAAATATQPTASRRFEIPDGTPIRLRLAQPVRGVTRSLVKIKVYSREGDTIRLVVADDVRVNGMVVIPKGAIGQATVASVQVPNLTSGGNYQKGAAVDLLIPKPGSVSLQLDWVEDVTGEQVSLRPLPTGESKPFVMSVSAEHGGMVVRPAKLKRDLKGLFTAHLRTWAPTGSRLTAYVDGATNIDPDDLKQAQELLPIPDGNGILTIYRTRGQIAEHVQVACDDKTIAVLGQLQYVAFEIEPRKHRCRIGQQQAFELNAEAGGQYFVHVRHKSLGGWELILVGVDEGEDGTASGELVEDASAEPVAH